MNHLGRVQRRELLYLLQHARHLVDLHLCADELLILLE